MIGESPSDKKFIFVCVPHTSNWDFIYAWLAIQMLDLNVKIFAKDIFFFWPVNYICHFLGILPVNRRKSTNFVDSVVQQLNDANELRFMIAPEGTRAYQDRLKSGYYHIARKASIPIVVAGLNCKDKTFTIMTPRAPLATFGEDEADLIEFCKTQHGYHPENTFK